MLYNILQSYPFINTPSNSPSTLSPSQLQVHFVDNNPSSPISVAHVHGCVIIHWGMVNLLAVTLPKESDSSSLSIQQLPIFPLAKGKPLGAPPQSMLEVWRAWSFAGLVQLITGAVSSGQPNDVQESAFNSTPPHVPALTFFVSPFLIYYLSLGWEQI